MSSSGRDNVQFNGNNLQFDIKPKLYLRDFTPTTGFELCQFLPGKLVEG